MYVLNDERFDKIHSLTNGESDVCYQCGSCSAHCPINALEDASLNVRKLVRSAQIGTDYSQDLWSCATCRLCEETCPRDVEIVDVIMGLRSLAFEERKAPDRIVKTVWDIYENGNPWGGNKRQRAKWAEGMHIKNALEGVKVLLYVGCETAYNKQMHGTARSIAKLLDAAGVDFGFLGNDERCCGEPVLNAGEVGYMVELAKNNIGLFEKTGAEIIVTVSPHCSNTFKSFYTKQGLKPRVMHYTEFLHSLLKEKKLDIPKTALKDVTYHDPCVLSRTDGFISGPREMLSLAVAEPLIEMDHSAENSICCGGGGDRMFLEFSGERLADQRIDEAKASGAKTLVTSCPYCVMNLHDSSSTRKAGIEVKDLAEILGEALQ